jgi:hypothetical protein
VDHEGEKGGVLHRRQRPFAFVACLTHDGQVVEGVGAIARRGAAMVHGHIRRLQRLPAMRARLAEGMLD